MNSYQKVLCIRPFVNGSPGDYALGGPLSCASSRGRSWREFGKGHQVDRRVTSGEGHLAHSAPIGVMAHEPVSCSFKQPDIHDANSCGVRPKENAVP